ncbi:MAG: FAD-binding oxidoreductase [Anaerolineaceae bacterium]|nr:FAD-binding oxidoreductase [Anaerolineaceae bacterium]
MQEPFEVIVVGAGYVGSSIAYHLCTAGVKTALFDRGLFAAAASRANYGNIQIQDMEMENSIEMIQMAAKKFETLEEELDWKVGLRRIGGLLLIENENQMYLMREREKVGRMAGFQSELLTDRELQEVEPLIDTSRLLGGLYHAKEGQVDPFQFIWGHLTRARQRGLREFYGVEVTGFIENSGRIEGIRTTQGDFYAKLVVLCTGAYTRALGKTLGRDWDVRYVLGQAMVTEPVGLALCGHISSASFFEQGDEIVGGGAVIANLALSQTMHGHLLLGEAMYTAEHFKKDVPYASLPGVGRAAVRYFPAFGKLRVLRGWCAPVAHTSDGCPFLGPVPELEGLFLATAFRSTVIISPLIGETVMQWFVRGNCDLNIEKFSPERKNQHAH